MLFAHRQKKTDELTAEQRAILKKIGKQTVIGPKKYWVVPINNKLVLCREDQVSVGKFFHCNKWDDFAEFFKCCESRV